MIHRFRSIIWKTTLELEFKDMKQTQYVDKTSLTLNPFNIQLKKLFFMAKTAR